MHGQKKLSFSDSFGGKDDRYVGLTVFQPKCAFCLDIWKLQPPVTLWGFIGLYRDCFTFACTYTYILYSQGFWESRFVQRMTSSLTQLIPQWSSTHVTGSKVWAYFICVRFRLLFPVHFPCNYTPLYISVQYTDSHTCFVIVPSAVRLNFCVRTSLPTRRSVSRIITYGRRKLATVFFWDSVWCFTKYLSMTIYNDAF
jgi:hypothetical protein